jgi:FKBP-type peptidyl-prolyl cis-trans isomerase SlyD
MRVAARTVVTLDYTLKNKQGEVLDSSDGSEPLSYLHGADQIVPGLERELEGLDVGAEKDVVVQPADGYGEIDQDARFSVPRASFPSDIVEGDALVGEDDEGNAMPVRVVEIQGDTVLVDANHPLAGEVLHFHVAVREVRVATEEELAHGHPHGPNGHDDEDDDEFEDEDDDDEEENA